MPSPFPGMDPYLEGPSSFPDLHDSLIAYLREALNAQLPQPYYAGINSRVWLERGHRSIGPDVDVTYPRTSATLPDPGTSALAVAEITETEPVVVHVPAEEARESFLEVYTTDDGERLVTIEVLSPGNKSRGTQARKLYRRKQADVLKTAVHLVEIDLLRCGTHTTAVPLDEAHRQAGRFDYHVCVRRYDQPQEYVVYPIQLSQRLPTIAVPLLPEDDPMAIALQPLLDRSYDAGRYARRVPHDDSPPPPPLDDQHAAWVKNVLHNVS